MKLSLEIGVPSPFWRRLPRARPIAREAIAAAAENRGLSEGGDVSLCLADDAALRGLNLSWRGFDKPTNVLSFPSTTAAHVDAVDDRVGRAHGTRLTPAVAPGCPPLF